MSSDSTTQRPDVGRPGAPTGPPAPRRLPDVHASHLPDGRVQDDMPGGVTIGTLDPALTVLNAREVFVLSRRFGLDGAPPTTFSMIGDQLGLSREMVRQIQNKAIARMQHPTVLRRLQRCGPYGAATDAVAADG